jgi:hypothetical protein
MHRRIAESEDCPLAQIPKLEPVNGYLGKLPGGALANDEAAIRSPDLAQHLFRQQGWRTQKDKSTHVPRHLPGHAVVGKTSEPLVARVRAKPRVRIPENHGNTARLAMQRERLGFRNRKRHYEHTPRELFSRAEFDGRL